MLVFSGSILFLVIKYSPGEQRSQRLAAGFEGDRFPDLLIATWVLLR